MKPTRTCSTHSHAPCRCVQLRNEPANPTLKDEHVRRALSRANEHGATKDVIYKGLGAALLHIPWAYRFSGARHRRRRDRPDRWLDK